MYYMLTGIRPQESIRRLISDEVRPLMKFPGIDLPDHKKQAIMKGMSVSAKDRYPDVSKLCQILYEEETVTGFVWWMKGKGFHLAVAIGLAACMILAAVTAARKVPATEDPASAGTSVVTRGAAASQLTDVSSDPAAVSGSGVSSKSDTSSGSGADAEPSRSPVKRVKMPDIQEMKLSKAEKKLNRMFDHVKIKIKRVYSSSTPADYVVKQSKKAGSYYRKDREFVVTLTVSRGKESTPTATPVRKTSSPVSTPVPGGTVKKGTKKNADMDDKDLAGELPW